MNLDPDIFYPGTDNTWKGLFINRLIQYFNFSTYLELGIAAELSWKQIECPVKIGVDICNVKMEPPHRDNTVYKFALTSTDDFFKEWDTNKKIDIIFIDALHEKTQVKKDFFNSLNILNKNGIIILHDINPPTEENTQPDACGDVFSFWMELCDNNNKNFYTVKPLLSISLFDAAWGPDADTSPEDTVGIYFHNKGLKEAPETEYQHNLDHSFALFDKHRKKYIDDRQVDLKALTKLN